MDRQTGRPAVSRERFDASFARSNTSPVREVTIADQRLLWLSCELQLRSSGITSIHAARSAKCILVYGWLEVFSASLAALLRQRGYETLAVQSLDQLRTAVRERPTSAVVAYLEPLIRGDSVFIDCLRLIAWPGPIVSFPSALPKSTEPTEPGVLPDIELLAL